MIQNVYQFVVIYRLYTIDKRNDCTYIARLSLDQKQPIFGSSKVVDRRRCAVIRDVDCMSL